MYIDIYKAPLCVIMQNYSRVKVQIAAIQRVLQTVTERCECDDFYIRFWSEPIGNVYLPSLEISKQTSVRT